MECQCRGWECWDCKEDESDMFCAVSVLNSKIFLLSICFYFWEVVSDLDKYIFPWQMWCFLRVVLDQNRLAGTYRICKVIHWQHQSMTLFISYGVQLNPSAWSDGHRPHTVNITCRGVTGTARMLHALTHSSISRQVREQM